MRRESVLAVGIGEIVWDRLPDGDAIGGAPFNVVSHLARLGHRAAYVSAVGRDELGDAAVTEVARRGVDPGLVGRVDAPTGLAQVTVGPDGSPVFTFGRPVAFERWAGDSPVARVTGMRPAFLVFGTMAQLRTHERNELAAIAVGCAGAVRLYDVNLRDGWWSVPVVTELAGLASMIKLSESEAGELAPALGVRWGPGVGRQEFCRGLARAHGLRGVAVTAGAGEACLLLDGDFALAAPPPAQVVDAVGAGDAFAAGLLDAIGHGLGAEAALRRANALGTLVASRRGAQPPWTEAELTALAAAPPA